MPDHAGGLCTAISETEKEHSETYGSHQSSGEYAGDEDSQAAHKQLSPVLNHGPGTGRRVSNTLPKWGGPFGGSSSTVDQVSESLHDKVAAQTAEAKPVPPQESPLDVAPSRPDEVKNDEKTLPSTSWSFVTTNRTEESSATCARGNGLHCALWGQ
ncbi:hypothetical protein MTO96_015545 [Rhipicephalus appendiculatus]